MKDDKNEIPVILIEIYHPVEWTHLYVLDLFM
jgi:hypothetical protein